MKTKPPDDEDYELIPPWEFGPGSRLDIKTNTLYGASGMIYHDVQLNAEDIKRVFERKKH